uniref:Phosphoadenosine phosphosulphate reductase domain-containing protein n=1 Tax=Bionectria ochroleuca TaxID=29856 RepID=A0A8H7NKB7_BIOOC
MAVEMSQSTQSYRKEDVEIDSGYTSSHSDYSPSSSTQSLPLMSLTAAHLEHLNNQLEPMHPMDILRFCKIMFPNLYQSTAFGLTGLVTMDMLSKIQDENPESNQVELIFLDTLYHFKETYDLIDRVKARYPNVPVHIFKPHGADNVEEFEETYGKELWSTSDELYDWIIKVEPLQRAYDELKVAAVLNGRRRSRAPPGAPSPSSSWTRSAASSRSTPSPPGPSARSTPTSRSTACPTTPCSTRGTSPSATGTRPAPSRRARTSAPAGGRARTRASAASTTRSPGMPSSWRTRSRRRRRRSSSSSRSSRPTSPKWSSLSTSVGRRASRWFR